MDAVPSVSVEECNVPVLVVVPCRDCVVTDKVASFMCQSWRIPVHAPGQRQ